ncbi:MAG: hypothetical protein WHV44_00555 [Anaerolineales bacterium]
MPPQTDEHTGFMGTYFDKTAVLRLSRAAAILGWVIFGYYLLQWAYSLWQAISSALTSNYPFDFSFLIYNTAQPFQGAMVLVFLLAASKVLLILLDIEDNTRRAARNRP